MQQLGDISAVTVLSELFSQVQFLGALSAPPTLACLLGRKEGEGTSSHSEMLSEGQDGNPKYSSLLQYVPGVHVTIVSMGPIWMRTKQGRQKGFKPPQNTIS